MASTTAVSPTTLWAGPRRGPVFELRDFFGGARERCDFHVEHYAHQHVTKNRFILVDAPLHYDQSVIEVALGNGFTAFQLLFHMGVTPMAHVWEDLYNKLSNPPTAIEDMDPDSLAQFLGVVLTQGQDKDEILTQFVRVCFFIIPHLHHMILSDLNTAGVRCTWVPGSRSSAVRPRVSGFQAGATTVQRGCLPYVQTATWRV